MADQSHPDDLHLFRDSVADVVPIKQDRVETFCRRRPPRLISQPKYNDNITTNITVSESEVITDEYLYFARPGIQSRVLLKLRQGRFEPQLELDLHGLTVAYAQENLDKFLAECRRRSLRYVRIIHGKGVRSEGGQPILKSKVNYWLRCYTDVLAFVSTPSWDGGSGALYVLLRNPMKNRVALNRIG